MRLEETEKADVFNVWMDDSELEQLRRSADTHRDEIIIQLGGFVGLRAFEVTQICPKHVIPIANGDYHHLHVPEGKAANGSSGQSRNAFLPASVESDIHRFQTSLEIAPDEPLVDLTTGGVRAVVKRTAERAAKQTNDDDYRYVSAHDLRRRFAQRLLVDRSVTPRVVMEVGGWRSFEAIKPFLAAPTTDVVREAFEAAGLS